MYRNASLARAGRDLKCLSESEWYEMITAFGFYFRGVAFKLFVQRQQINIDYENQWFMVLWRNI